MPWTFYRLKFQVLSQLHIGHQRIGNIQRTRHYVPARVFWGALTARLTRDPRACAAAKVAEGNYVAMGELVKEEIAFSYFFPAIEDQLPAYPVYQDAGLCYGQERLSREEFTWRYLGSYASTALNYEHNAADEGSLHEIEFISPNARDNDGSYPVFLVGYMIVAEGCVLPWRSALQEIQIGGERTYGWGRLQLAEAQQQGYGSAVLFDHLPCDAKTEDRPRILLEGGAPLLAHTSVAGTDARGEVEPLVGRAWEQSKGAGQHVEFTDVCYAPGAKLNGSKSFDMTINHIWKASSS